MLDYDGVEIVFNKIRKGMAVDPVSCEPLSLRTGKKTGKTSCNDGGKTGSTAQTLAQTNLQH
jgi:hypothetical protein